MSKKIVYWKFHQRTIGVFLDSVLFPSIYLFLHCSVLELAKGPSMICPRFFRGKGQICRYLIGRKWSVVLLMNFEGEFTIFSCTASMCELFQA